VRSHPPDDTRAVRLAEFEQALENPGSWFSTAPKNKTAAALLARSRLRFSRWIGSGHALTHYAS